MCAGGTERLFQSVGPDQRRAAVVLVLLADFVGDIDPRVGLVHLLIGQRLGENGIEIRGFQRLFRCGIQRRHRLVGHVGHDVVPPGRNLRFRKDEAFCFRAHCFTDFGL